MRIVTDGMRCDRAFQTIYDTTKEHASPVGFLTGVNRDSWTEVRSCFLSIFLPCCSLALPTRSLPSVYQARVHLLASPSNASTLKTIEDSAFLLTLDEARPTPQSGFGTTYDGLKEFSARTWKAGGKGLDAKGKGEGGNRWWDKPLQWVVYANGESGIVGEHSCMDG